MRYLCIFLFASVLMTGCGEERDDLQSSAGEGCVKIGLAICMTPETPFFVSLLDGVRTCANACDAEVVTVYAYEDPGLQSEQILELAGNGMDILLLVPVNDSVNAASERVVEMGIPVITLDRGISGGGVSCHISSDNFDGGRMAGEYLAEALHRRGSVVEITGTTGSSAATERGQGFHQALLSYPRVEIIRSFSADFSRDQAYELFRELLRENEHIDGVFAHNDDMILGAIDAASEAGVHGILFIGFDAIDEAIDYLEEGALMATVAQRPFEMGHLGVETAMALLRGDEIPDSITVDLALILK